MRMPAPEVEPTLSSAPPQISRKCEACEEEEEKVQRKEANTAEPGLSEVPASVREVLRTPGEPLDEATRADFEPRFGHHFRHVRIHADEQAAASARAINALAYTAGHHLVFSTGQYSPTTTWGRRLLAHELVHSIQQGFASNPVPHQATSCNTVLQRQSDYTLETKVRYSGHEGDDLANKMLELTENNVKNYRIYHDAILKANSLEKRVALNTQLLFYLENTIDFVSFAKCVELLGRRAPTFDELRNNSLVYEAIKLAWMTSNPGKHGSLLTPLEQGGWVFLNLIDGSLSTRRSDLRGRNFIDLNHPPDVEHSVIVAEFHTHPNLGGGANPKPSRGDRSSDTEHGVPDLVAGTPGTDPDVFEIYLSGPPVRKHLASSNKIPGVTGGDAP